MCLIASGGSAALGAEIGPLQLVLEPGVANLAGSEEQPGDDAFPGKGAGLSVALAVGSLVSLGLHLDHKWLTNRAVETTLTTWDVTVIYHLDVGMVRPFGALGLAGVQRNVAGQAAQPGALAPTLAVGVDITPWRRLLVGAVVRYYLVDSADLLAPSQTHLALRVGLSVW